jgi:protein required for attachment to host cells
MNEQMLIAVIDRAHARFLMLVPAKIPEAGFTFIEQTGLTLPEGEASGAELWSSPKTGRNRGPQRQAHSYDDHRQERAIEFERHFAHSIASHMHLIVQDRHLQAVLLVAAPQILGLMRQALESVLPQTVQLTELAKDLCHLTPYEIQEYLVEQELIPTPQRLGISPT